MFHNYVLNPNFKIKKRTLNYDGTIKVVTSRDIKRITKPVIEWSKEFFKKADMTNVFYHILNHKENVIVINQLQPIHKFYRNSVPEINVILDGVINGLPVRDKKSITFLRKNPQYRKDFIREYDSNGNWYYDYNPVEAERRRIEDVKNSYARPKITKATASDVPRYVLWRGDEMIIKETGLNW